MEPHSCFSRDAAPFFSCRADSVNLLFLPDDVYRHLDVVALRKAEEELRIELCGIVRRADDAVVVGESEPVDAVEVDDAGVEDAEGVSLDADVAVVSACRAIRDSAADGDAGCAPAQTAVVSVFETVVPDRDVAHAGLFEPEVAVPLEEDRGAGDVEVVLLDDHLPARTDQQPAGAVSGHPASPDQHVGTGLVGGDQMARSDRVGEGFGEGHLRELLVEALHLPDCATGIGRQRAVVYHLDLHALAEEVDAVLPAVGEPEPECFRADASDDGHVDAVDVCGVVLLVEERAVEQADLPRAVGEMGGVGRKQVRRSARAGF